MLAQLFGAFLGLGLGYLLRIQQTMEDNETMYMTPDVNNFSPPILLATDGKPTYGQVMLSEFIATYIFISIVLVAKRNSEETNGKFAAAWILVIGVALMVVGSLAKEISGGIVNPAIAAAVIIW